MSELFSQVIDLERIHNLIDCLQQATGVPVSLIDDAGELLTCAGWHDLCRLYHSASPLGQRRCRATRERFASRRADDDRRAFSEHVCANGLLEIGLPVVIGEQQHATLIFGQFLPAPPDKERFRAAAVDLGVDPESYLEALDRVPIYDRSQVEKMLGVYAGIIGLITRIGDEHLEQKRASEELLSSEATFQALFNNSCDAIYIVALDGRILEVNEPACERLGYSREEMCSMTMADLGGPEHEAAVCSRLLRFRRESQYIYETEHRTRDGRDIPVEVSGRVISFRGAEAVLCTARDLSERIDSMRALQKSEARFRSIIDASPMGVLLYELHADDRLELVGVNPSAATTLGIDPVDYIGKSLEEAFPGLVGTDVARIYRQVCHDGEPYFKEQLDYTDGVIRGVFEVHAFQTEPGRMAVFFTDITERKRAERIMLESEEKYRLLFSAEKDAILIVDHDTLQVVDANDAALELYGYSRDALCAKTFADLHVVEDDLCLEAIRDNSQELIASTHQRQNGEEFPVEITSGPFAWAGKQLCVAIVRDVSERETIHQLKDEMLSSISHEMRTPLTAILGFTELMLSGQFDHEREQHFLRLSYKEGERLRDLVDDLLDLQRLRAGFVGEAMEPVDVALLLYEVAGLFSVTESRYSLRVECEEGLPRPVGDARKLLRALKNLLSNAIKYSPDGGEICLRAGLSSDGTKMLVSVEDHGLGVPEEARGQLFDRFFRVYHPKVKNIGGTGLGLALVKEIARVHGGRVWFDSVLGQGSTFTIELPLAGPEKGSGLTGVARTY